jgi:hypothetical protein
MYMENKDLQNHFSKISDKVPELARETSYEVYYGVMDKEHFLEYMASPIEYLEKRSLPKLDGFQIRSTIINQELIGQDGDGICYTVTLFPKKKQAEAVIIAHRADEHQEPLETK